MVKPEPEIYKLLLERIKFSANEYLFIDDSFPNVKAAQNLGFHAVHFRSPDELETKLRELGLL